MIPVLYVEGETLPDVWEKSLIETWYRGCNIETQYDKEGDPPSKDCTMIMVVKNPFKEPRIHRCLPGGLGDLEIYKREVIDGIHDHWIDPFDENKWWYTYHDRLFNYDKGYPRKEKGIDQIAEIVNKLASVSYTRRAQAITWYPWIDLGSRDPPCLQRIWCRIDEDEEKLYLNMNTNWRSRDAFKAAFMNMYAMTELQKIIAEKIAEKIGKEILVGRYMDYSDSYHIYGSYFKDPDLPMSFQSFLEMLENRSFQERTWTTDEAIAFGMIEDAEKKLGRENK